MGARPPYERILADRLRGKRRRSSCTTGRPTPPGEFTTGRSSQGVEGTSSSSQLIMGRRAPFRPAGIVTAADRAAGGKGPGRQGSQGPSGCGRVPGALPGHALKYVDVMRASSSARLLGLWDDPYLTLSKSYEATVVRQCGLCPGRMIYRDRKPVHWCLVHNTALAEAEVEYADHTSPSSTCACRSRGGGRGAARAGRQARGVRHLDDNAVDAARQPGGGGESRAGVRRVARHPRWIGRVPAGGARPGGGVPDRVRAGLSTGSLGQLPREALLRLQGAATSRSFRRDSAPRACPSPPEASTASTSRGTRRWKRAPASCTRRPDTALTTTSSVASTGCGSTRPSDEAGA